MGLVSPKSKVSAQPGPWRRGFLVLRNLLSPQILPLSPCPDPSLDSYLSSPYHPPSSAQTLYSSPLLNSCLTHPAGNPQTWGMLSPIPQTGSCLPLVTLQDSHLPLHGSTACYFKKCFTLRARATSLMTLPVSSRDPRVHTSLGTSTHPSLELQEAH